MVLQVYKWILRFAQDDKVCAKDDKVGAQDDKMGN
jgi:hypothetical protein